MAEGSGGKLFLPVPDVKLMDLLNWQDPEQRKHRHLITMATDHFALKISLESLESQPHKKCFGKSIHLNDKSIALFRVGREVYATQAECPHAGGPLYLADIEEMIPGQLSLTCPWHKWKFDIDTGKTVHPYGRDVNAKVYPVRVDEDGKLFIGFDSLGPSAFRTSF